ncbi:MAG TPA: hypothetical protein VJW20_13215 [Candidatus Angelobacter sp.]|nr:hypothetical protein [Candidatus Angelobacter sp.]
MRKIDPQSERLTDALRRLAASSPQSAPPQVAAGLLGEFRRHHARRRRNRQLAIAGLAICLVVAAVVIALPSHRPSNTMSSQTAKLPEATATPAKQEQPAVAPVAAINPVKRPAVKQIAANREPVKPTVNAANRAFLALPGYDPTVPLDELHVVRMQLPADALWQMGAPVSANAGSNSVTADFVVSQGGTPYAVRLVQ